MNGVLVCIGFIACRNMHPFDESNNWRNVLGRCSNARGVSVLGMGWKIVQATPEFRAEKVIKVHGVR